MATKAKNSLKVEVSGKTVAKIDLRVTGLFAFPVKLYTPFETGATYSLRLACPACKSPVVQPRRCSQPTCGNHSGFPDYEKPIRVAVQDETVVEITEADLDELNLPTVGAFVTEAVLPIKQTESLRMFGDGGYYLVPETSTANMAYAALCAALKKSKAALIGRYQLRGKVERLGLILPMEDLLVVQNIPFANERKPLPKFEKPEITAKHVEQAQALLSMGTLTAPFTYEAITDRYADAMQELVTEKALSGKVTPREKKPEAEGSPAERGRDLLSEMFTAAGV